jgi:hypothetical protein
MIRVQNGNRVVRWAVLEDDYESAVAKSPWTLSVRDFAVVKQLCAISLREMLATFREHVVALGELMRGPGAYSGLIQDLLLGGLRCDYEDEIYLSHACEKRAEGGRWIIPGVAHLLPGTAEIIQENHDIILPKFLGIAIRQQRLPKQITPRDEQFIQML